MQSRRTHSSPSKCLWLLLGHNRVQTAKPESPRSRQSRQMPAARYSQSRC
ncbi:Uncharacterised protein [Vibrio cholerae]|nr:Uncharacterised protein [Vibrio cholerae]CSI56949.1 Uncharacterised protein [Vibrio cholerae]